jgi:hypothetical protein
MARRSSFSAASASAAAMAACGGSASAAAMASSAARAVSSASAAMRAASSSLGAHLFFHRGDGFGGFGGIGGNFAGEDGALLQRGHAFAKRTDGARGLVDARAKGRDLIGHRRQIDARCLGTAERWQPAPARRREPPTAGRARFRSRVGVGAARAGQKAGDAGEIADTGGNDAADDQGHEAGAAFLDDPFGRRGGAGGSSAGGVSSTVSVAVSPVPRECVVGSEDAQSVSASAVDRRRRSWRRLSLRSSALRVVARPSSVVISAAWSSSIRLLPTSGRIRTSDRAAVDRPGLRRIRGRSWPRPRRHPVILLRRVFLVTGSACAFGGSSRHATVPSIVYRPNCLTNVTHGPSQP